MATSRRPARCRGGGARGAKRDSAGFSLVVPMLNRPYEPRSKLLYVPRPPNGPLLRALWSLLDGIWGVLKGSWGVLAVFKGSLHR